MAQTEEQLKAKYQSVLTVIQQLNGSLKNVNMEGEKLLIRAEVANDDLKNQVWDAVKRVDASYPDVHPDILVNSSLTAPTAPPSGTNVETKTYKVQAGDNLSKIAEQFYGKASQYNKIFDANRDQLSNPNQIRAGMELVIPA